MAIVLVAGSCGGTSPGQDAASIAIDAPSSGGPPQPAADDGSTDEDVAIADAGRFGNDGPKFDPPGSQYPPRPPGVACRKRDAQFSPGPYPADILEMVALADVAVTGVVVDVFPPVGKFSSFNVTVEDWSAPRSPLYIKHFALRLPLPTDSPVVGLRRHYTIDWFAGNGEGIEVGSAIWEVDPVAFPRFVVDFAAMTKFIDERRGYDGLADLDAIIEGTVIRPFGESNERTMVVRIDRSLCGPPAGEIVVYFDQANACNLGCGPPPQPGAHGVFHLTWLGGATGVYLQRRGNLEVFTTLPEDEAALAAVPALRIEGPPVNGGIRRLLPEGNRCWLNRFNEECAFDGGLGPDQVAPVDASLDVPDDGGMPDSP
jgi:hypothetical protein